MARQQARARAEHGQMVVFVAVGLVALIGIGALSVDAAFMYDKRNTLYAAADAAAKSAAFAYKADTSSDLRAFAEHEVTSLGLTPVNACGATSGTALCVNRPPTQGPYAGNGKFVEAIVSAPSTGTFFGRLLGWMAGNPGARAVAGTVDPADCVIVNQNLSMGNFEFVLGGCGVSVGGNLTGTNPNAEVTDPDGGRPPVNVKGTCSGDCGGMGDLHTGAPAPADPLAGKLPTWTWPTPATCGGTGALTTIDPGCYNNIGPAVTTLNAGDYYITGTVNIDSLTGNDVFLYLTNECGAPCGSHPGGGGFNVIGQNKLLHLTPHTTGPYQGIAVWQVEADTRPFSCIGCGPGGATESFPPNSFRLEWSGALYMPGVDQEYKNHVEFVPLNGCALYLTRNLTVKNGNGSLLNTNCASLFGGSAFLSIAVTE